MTDYRAEALRGTVQTLLELYVRASLELPPSRGGGAGKVSGTRERPLPLRGELVVWMAGCVETCVRLEEKLRYRLRHSRGACGGRRGARLQKACGYLSAQSEALVRDVEACAELEALRRAGERELRLDRLVTHLGVACPSCGLRALTRENGASEVVCGSCGRADSEEMYAHLVKTVVAEHQAKAV